MKHIRLLALLLCAALLLCGCDYLSENGPLPFGDPPASASLTAPTEQFSLSDVPEWSGEPYVEVAGNVPFFTEDELVRDAFELYSPLDKLGRCGTAYANLCEELLPTEERENISSVKPTGWQSVRYDFVDQYSLYNRCHLIAFQLAGENANERNLITGTRNFNTEGMLPFEHLAGDYVRATGNHVLYRVTPFFKGDDLVAAGVLMEGLSVEDRGAGVRFCVFVYNVEPGIVIDYATGDSRCIPGSEPKTYVINTRSGKFHDSGCRGVAQISSGNRWKVTCSREVLIARGYEPCGECQP